MGASVLELLLSDHDHGLGRVDQKRNGATAEAGVEAEADGDRTGVFLCEGVWMEKVFGDPVLGQDICDAVMGTTPTAQFKDGGYTNDDDKPRKHPVNLDHIKGLLASGQTVNAVTTEGAQAGSARYHGIPGQFVLMAVFSSESTSDAKVVKVLRDEGADASVQTERRLHLRCPFCLKIDGFIELYDDGSHSSQDCYFQKYTEYSVLDRPSVSRGYR